MKTTTVTLRCKDNAEALVFSIYDYEHDNFEKDYEFSFEDSYFGKNKYVGFFGRLRRAWEAFKSKPVCYCSVVHEDKKIIEKFLNDCLTKIKEE